MGHLANAVKGRHQRLNYVVPVWKVFKYLIFQELYDEQMASASNMSAYERANAGMATEINFREMLKKGVRAFDRMNVSQHTDM